MAGILAEFYLIRAFSVRPVVAAILLICQAVISIANVYPFDVWLHGAAVFPAGLLTMWWWSIVPVALVVWLSRWFPAKPFSPGRRKILRSSFQALAAAPAVALCTGIIIRKDLVVREVPMKFHNLPKDLQGVRLVQLSDIHIGAFYTAADLARAVDAANGLRADVMLITGDLISTRYDPLEECLQELKRLRASNGIWGCLGNHEMHAEIEAHTAKLANQVGIHFLRQENEQLRFGRARLNLVGVDHQRRERPYLQHTSELISPDDFNLLLSHNPDVFPVAAKQGFDLTISGHTHGGQINMDLLGSHINAVDLVTPFTKGEYHLAKSSLYVNSGLGTIGVPVRLGSPPEVTLITLCNF